MQEQERGIKVLCENKEYLIDMDLTQFRDVRKQYTTGVLVKMFIKAPFDNESAVKQVPILELILIAEAPEKFTDSGMLLFEKLISTFKSISCPELDPCMKWQCILSGATAGIETLSEKEKTDRLEVIYYLQNLFNKKDYEAMPLNYPAG